MTTNKTIKRNTNDQDGYFVLRRGKLPPPKISSSKESIISSFTVKLVLISILTIFCTLTGFAQFTTTSTPVNPYCIGASNGSITLTASAGVAPYTVQMLMPTAGSVITMSGSPASYSYTGLSAGVYSFRILDGAGSTVNRTVTLSNPASVTYTINHSGTRFTPIGCDSVDAVIGFVAAGTARPPFKLDYWINATTATGSPTISYTGLTSVNQRVRIPTPASGGSFVVRLTDSCGNVSNLTTALSASMTTSVSASKTVCNKADVQVQYNGLKTPVTFTLDSAGTIIQTITQNTNAWVNPYLNGGSFIGVSTGNYTLTGTDSCGKVYTRTISVTVPNKFIPSAANSLSCQGTSVDSTTTFRISSLTWTKPYVLTVVSGPSTYNHTNIAGVIDPNITYPMSKTVGVNDGTTFYELSNMPMGTYRIAVLDGCGWTDTVDYVIDANNIVKIDLDATITPGCLDANTVTVNGTFSCFRPETIITLKNSAGVVVGTSGVTSSPLSFSTYNLPAGNYTINLTGITTASFATGGTSILTHLASGRPSMVIPVSFAPYSGPTIGGGILAAPCPNTLVGGTIVTSISGVPPYSYELLNATTNAVVRPSQSTDTCINLPTGVTYKYRVTDACGNVAISNNVTLNALSLTLAATSSKSCVAIGSSVTLSTDSINATIYTWSGPNGFTASGRTIVITNFTNAMAGTYIVTATTLGGCVNTASVTINSLPVIAAITGTTTVCLGQNTNLSSTTTGGVWKSVTPSVASISASGLVTGVSAGTSVIRYIVTNSSGCIDSVSAIVTVNALPTIAAITGTTNVCVGKTTQLANTTLSGVWKSVSTSNASISATGLVTGLVAGTSAVRYTVTNANGCIDSVSATVTVNALPTIASIGGTLSTGIMSSTTLTNATTGGVWKSVSTNIATVSATGVVTGVAAGTSIIRYTVTNASGCVDSVSATVTVNSFPSVPPITGVLTICVGKTTALSNTTTGGVWKSVSTNIATVNSSTGVVTGILAGSAEIRYVITNIDGSKDSSSTTVTINALPVISPISGTLTACVGRTTTLSSTTIGGVWTSVTPSVATINSSTGLVTGVSVGTSVIRYTVTNVNGCVDSASATVTINALPVISPISGTLTACVDKTTTLTSTTTGGVWKSVSTGVATISTTGIVTGVSAGTSIIRYTVTNANGCVDSASATVTINALPTIAAITGNTTLCAGTTSTLSSTTTSGVWKSVSTSVATISATGVVTGITAGTSVIRYTVTNANGCVDSVSTTVSVSGKPNAGIDLVDFCAGSNTNLTGLPSGGTWTAQTGSTGFTLGSTNAGVANILFSNSNAAGNYNLIYTSNGCTDTLNIKTKVCCTKPVFSPSSTTICEGENATLTVTNGVDSFGSSSVNTVYTNDFDSIVGSNWSFTNESSVSRPTITSFNGNKLLGYLGAQQATFNLNGLPIHDSIEVAFDLYLHDTWDGNSTEYFGGQVIGEDFWKMSVNGSTVINTTFSNFNYRTQAYPNNIGTANPAFTGSASTNLGAACNTAGGAQTSKYRIVRKVAHNSANLTIDLAGINLENVCNESWSIDNFVVKTQSQAVLSNVNWLNIPTIGKTVQVSPTASKYYIVELAGCRDSVLVTVKSTPKANFTINNASQCIGATNFNFTNSSTMTDGSALTYSWSLPSASTTASTSTNVSGITYANAGSYTVTLMAKAAGSTCADSIDTLSKTISVNAKPIIVITKTALNGCGNTLQFGNTGDSASYAWTFGDASTSTQLSPVKTYAAAGSFKVKLTSTNANACSAVDSTTVNVTNIPSGNAASFTTSLTGSCGNMVTLTNTSTGTGNVYVWNFGDGNTSSEENPVHYYTDGGAKTITLTILNGTGCGAVASNVVNISTNSGMNGRVGVDFSIAPNATQVLMGNSFGFYPVFTNNNDNNPPLYCAGSPTWNYGDGTGSNNTTIYAKKYTSAGVYTVSIVQKTTGTGCYAAATKVVTVIPTPLLAAVGNKQTQDKGNILADKASGIENVSEASNQIDLYPNPNAGTFKVRLNGLALENGVITIVNVLGKEVYSANFHANFSNYEIEINNLNIANGTYYIVISSNGVAKARKQFVNIAE